jgi:type 2 lantibiotic biosynthesis protein LanM
VAHVETSLSDPHRGGRVVIALRFESGLRLVYKPKDMTPEATFNRLLAWCNQRRHDGRLLDLRPLKVLERSGYGWVEQVEQEPCADEAAAARFYERAGILLCLLYLLRGTDCHNENLIAAGEHLVLIDAETLLHHDARPFEDSAAFVGADASSGHRFWDSVVRVGLLPRWDFSPDRRLAYDISGLGGADPEQAVRWVSRWRAINTDAMHQAREQVTAPLGKNVPVMRSGSALSASDHQVPIVAGFATMYRFLMAHRDELAAPDGPLMAMRRQPARFVFRATRVYAALLERLLAPEHLRDGADFGFELDQLSVAFLAARSRPRAWPVLAAERHALERLDIPYFVAGADTSELALGEEGGAVVPDHFARPSFEAALERLQSLDEADLAWQVAIIEGSFHAMAARSSHEADGGHDLGSATPLRGDGLVEAARSIAAELAARAVRDPKGGASWVGLGLVHEAERFQLQPLGDSLYDGRGGVALFLAALHAVTGEMRHRDLALRALEPLRRRLREPDPESRRRDARLTGIGGAGGLGSLVYALAATGRLLADRTLLDDATALAGWITSDLVAADERLDVIGGAAGAALGLLALHAATGEAAVLATAAECGRHLLNRRVSHEGAPAAWRTLGEERPLTGFSHGAAGIAYALLRLHAATGDEACRAAALEAIAYERGVFSAEQANWPDFRAGVTADGRPGYPVQWCHGAPGIALARLGGLGVAGGPEVEREIEVALRTTQGLGLQALDHLCCGNMGRVETLLVGGERLARPDCREEARRIVAQVVTRAGRTGGAYRLFGNLPPSVFSPALFRGTAGIGYGLLRLADGSLPSALLWE